MAERTRRTKETEEPFERMLERLEGLVKRLEGGDLSLEDSLAAYEEGVFLVRRAQGRLDTLDQRLEQLLEDGQHAPLAPPSGLTPEETASDGEGSYEDGLDDDDPSNDC